MRGRVSRHPRGYELSLRLRERAPLIELLTSALVTFFVIIDPPGCAPIFASLTQGPTAPQRRAMAIRSVLIAADILPFFGLFGEYLLSALAVSLATLRIPDGNMLFLLALGIVLHERTDHRGNRAQGTNATLRIEETL